MSENQGFRPKLSGFTFLRNAVELGYPFEESIRSILPIVDEMVVVVGSSRDDTLERVRSLQDSKIKVIETVWNEKMQEKSFVYAQQKMIAQYACVGDWAFYLEADEVLHEDDHAAILKAVSLNHARLEVEAIVFDYKHFYGSAQWLAVSPAWYRRECRIIRNTIRTFAPDGQFWVVMDRKRQGRYPRAALAHASIYHYGHARSVNKMQEKMNQVSRYWGHEPPKVQYEGIHPSMAKPFLGAHPHWMKEWISKESDPAFQPDIHAKLGRRDLRHRLVMLLEQLFALELGKKNYRLIRGTESKSS